MARVQANGKLFLSLAKAAGLDTATSEGHSIVSVIVGDLINAGRLAERLLIRGLNVLPIIYPAVPLKAARFRFFITSEHTPPRFARPCGSCARRWMPRASEEGRRHRALRPFPAPGRVFWLWSDARRRGVPAGCSAPSSTAAGVRTNTSPNAKLSSSKGSKCVRFAGRGAPEYLTMERPATSSGLPAGEAHLTLCAARFAVGFAVSLQCNPLKIAGRVGGRWRGGAFVPL